jgi:hypothetical protein
MHDSPIGNATGPRPGVRDALQRCCALDVRSLAAFRIALGLVLVADALLRARDFSLMFAADGVFPPALIRDYFDGDPAHWSLALLWNDTRWAAAILVTEALAGVCLAAGWRTTTATVLAWIAQVSVFRRTIPAANAGDLLLSCLLFWSCFLPLGAVWSCDACRRATGGSGPPPARVYGPATVALMLQVMAVYVGAGLAKWNGSWLGGEAVRYALSVHDHGTPLGMWLADAAWLVRPMTWGVLGTEILAPLVFIAWPAARAVIAVTFLLFHVMIWLTMSVGLFAPIGMVAWLPLLPGSLWNRVGPRLTDAIGHDCPAAAARRACVAAALLAAVSFAHDRSPWRARPLPAPIRQAIHAASLTQEWGMFGTVPPLEQWAYAPGELADGRVVDVLRDGRPIEAERPTGGFTSLPHHRWHKLLWILPRPKVRPFAPSVAAALARDWNARHAANEQLVTLEIRFAQRNLAAPDAPLQEMLVGAWPDRDAGGVGNLDRFLEADRAGRPLR